MIFGCTGDAQWADCIISLSAEWLIAARPEGKVKAELLNNTNSWGANYVFSIPGKISAKHPLQSLCRQMKPVLCGGLPPPPRGSGVLAPNFLSQTGRWRNNVLNLSAHSFVCYQTCEQDILKTKKPILMPIGTNGSQGLRMV